MHKKTLLILIVFCLGTVLFAQTAGIQWMAAARQLVCFEH